MEQRILRKLNEMIGELEVELSQRADEAARFGDVHARAELAKFEKYVDGFCAAMDVVGELVAEEQNQMARDYGQDGGADAGEG
jgi:hypothetical protein